MKFADTALQASARTRAEERRTWIVDEFDLMAASWVIASLMLGPPPVDRTIERDAIECDIRDFLRASFAATDRPAKGPMPNIPPTTVDEQAIAVSVESVLEDADCAFGLQRASERYR